MCNYIHKELSCQHHHYIVESWCPKYIKTERRCPPTIVRKQYWFLANDCELMTAAACRERQEPSGYPWAKLIQRPESRTSCTSQLSAQ
ncbi:hypothetical protein BKA56DRAFT_564912 [Ilyonectria sp. MPI-CAGE-AT-0026]|nr:hypothetical protein BKA56DRAFT_564912 [Ilyonectria sp. MPI-CAGE-AT-0026]